MFRRRIRRAHAQRACWIFLLLLLSRLAAAGADPFFEDAKSWFYKGDVDAALAGAEEEALVREEPDGELGGRLRRLEDLLRGLHVYLLLRARGLRPL